MNVNFIPLPSEISYIHIQLINKSNFHFISVVIQRANHLKYLLILYNKFCIRVFNRMMKISLNKNSKVSHSSLSLHFLIK